MSLFFDLAGLLISTILDVSIAVSIYDAYWRRGSVSRLRKLLLLTSIVVLAACGAFPRMQTYYAILVYTIVFLLSFFYEMNGLWRLLGLSLFFVSLAVGESTVSAAAILLSLLDSISHIPRIHSADPALYTALLFASKACSLVITRLIAHKRRGRVLPRSFELSLLFLACPMVCFLFNLAFHSMRPYVDSHAISYLGAVTTWIMFASNIFFIYLVEHITQMQTAQREQELDVRALEQESARYQQFLRQHSETARTMHDIRNQLAAAIGLLRDGQAEESVRLIDRLTAATHGHTSGISGNAAMDSILYAKQSQLQELAIRLIPQISMPDSCGISYEDLAVVLGNLLDNAIAACELLPEETSRTVTVTVRQVQDYLCFKVEHPIPPVLWNVEEEDPLYPRFGLRTVRLLAEKYDGNVQTQRCDGRFSVTVLMVNLFPDRLKPI